MFDERSWTGTDSTYALLHEDTELALILNIDELLAAIGRVADVQLLEEIISECLLCGGCRYFRVGVQDDQARQQQSKLIACRVAKESLSRMLASIGSVVVPSFCQLWWCKFT
jgi:hypothetical protein